MKKVMSITLFLIFCSSFIFARGAKEEISLGTSGDMDYQEETLLRYNPAALNLANFVLDKHYTIETTEENGNVVQTIKLTEEGFEELLKSKVFYLVKKTYDGQSGSSSEGLPIYYGTEEWKNLPTSLLDQMVASIYKTFEETNEKIVKDSMYSVSYFGMVLDTISESVISALNLRYLEFTGQEKETTTDDNITPPPTPTDQTTINKTLDIKDGNIKSPSPSGKNILTFILLSLLTAELLSLGIKSLMSHEFPLQEIFIRLIFCVIVLFLITNIWNIIEIIERIFVKAGNTFGNATKLTAATSEELRPSDVLKGYNQSSIVFNSAEYKMQEAMGTLNSSKFTFPSLTNLLIGLGFIIGKFILFLVYAITALYVLLWQIELRILVIIATFLLPFKVFKHTDFLARGIWPTLLGQCLKLFVVAFMVRFSSSLFLPVFTDLQEMAQKVGYTPAFILFGYIPGVVAIAIIISYFTLKAPETARALLVGSPTTDGNIQGMAVRMGTKAASAPLMGLAAATTTGKVILGSNAAKKEALFRNGGVDPIKHSGAINAYTSRGISGLLSYGAYKGISTGINNIRQSRKNHKSTDNNNIDKNSRNVDSNMLKDDKK